MSRRDEIISGIFILASVAAILVGAVWLSEADWRGEREVLTASFQSVGQLRTGQPVTYRGVEIGRAERIAFTDSGVEVDFRIRADSPLPEDPVVVLRPRTLFGEWGASVEAGFRHPDVSRPVEDPLTEVLPGKTGADFAQLSDFTEEIALNLETITERVALALDEETAEQFSRIVANVETTSRELSGLVEDQRGQLGDFSGDLGEVGRSLRRISSDLEATLARLDAATAEGELEAIFDNAAEATAALDRAARDIQATSQGADRTLSRAESTLGEMEEIIRRVNRGEGTMGRLATDQELYEDLSVTLIQLRALLEDLRTNPDRYFRFSIF